MSDIVLIPCFKRPEFLAVCLQYIQKAKFANEHKYIFLLDYGFDRAILGIIESFPYPKQIVKTPNKRYGLGKQSHNLLEGYKLATQQTDGLVYLIEEDIMIANDFFQWHRLAQDKINFCTIATANNNTKNPKGTKLDGWHYGSKTDYQSLGVCWQSSILKKYIIPHATHEYYKAPLKYCDSIFTTSFIYGSFAEQDGLIRRIKELSNLPVIFADVPRAFHGGFIGYNRNRHKTIKGTLEQKIAFVSSVMLDAELMRQQAERPEFFEDSKPINLVNAEWQSK